MTRQRGMQRRDFMRLSLAGSAVLPSVVLGRSEPEVGLQWLQVADDWAAPVAGKGDWLAVEADARAFSGDGLYLYPAWGSPKPYLVRAVAASSGLSVHHEFCNPATGRVLWTDTGTPRFAGRVHGRLPAQLGTWLGHMPQLPLLELPRLPA
jgi:hypothetical protein